MAVEIHTHESDPEGRTLGQQGLSTSAVSISGSSGSNTEVNIALTAWCFFPMIYTSSRLIRLVGHATDAADPDSPRFRLYFGTSGSYAIAYRHLNP